jgi:hypothetical protein
LIRIKYHVLVSAAPFFLQALLALPCLITEMCERCGAGKFLF